MVSDKIVDIILRLYWGAEIKGEIMASFDKKINNCARLDWQILINGSISLYYDRARRRHAMA